MKKVFLLVSSSGEIFYGVFTKEPSNSDIASIMKCSEKEAEIMLDEGEIYIDTVDFIEN